MNPSVHKTYFPHIDGLRAIAIVSVVLYHLNPDWLPGGFSGVDIFFVISGFVVSASVASAGGGRLGRFIGLFYARRLQRIVPALVVCLVVTSLATAILIPSAWLSMAHQKTGIYAFFGLSNLVLVQADSDYFSPVAEFNPYTHTWSLAVEEQFYLLFPILFFAWTLGGRRRRMAVGLFAAAFAASLGYSMWLGDVDKASAFYMITSRFWELAAGVLLFQIMALSGRRFDTAEQRPPRWALGGAFCSVLLIGYGLAVSTPEAFPFPGAIPAVLGALGLLGFLHGAGGENPLARIITAGPVLFVGKISYSLYLWHWPVFVLFRWTVGLEASVHRLAALSVVVALAIASYFWVEMPLRRLPLLARLPRYAVVSIGLAVIGSSAVLASRINDAQQVLSVSTVTRNAHDWYPEAAEVRPAYPGCGVQVAIASLGVGQVFTYSRESCPHPVAGPRVFAIGDSHAIGYASLYRGYAMETGAPVIVYDNGGCPFLSLQPWREDTDVCRASREVALKDMLGRIQPGDVVFLASLRLPRFADQFFRYPDRKVEAAVFSESAIDARVRAVAAAREVLHQFSVRGAEVIFEAPKPIFRSPIYRCAEVFNRSNPACSDGVEFDRAELERLRGPIVGALRYLSAAVPGVHVWDPFPVLCPPGERCSAYADGRPLFFDADHVSGYGNRLLLPSFRACVVEACRDRAGIQEAAATVFAPAPQAYVRKIHALFIGILGRPPTPAELRSYEAVMNANGGNYLVVANALWNSAEARPLYAGVGVEEVVRVVFRNLFGREARPAGIGYWSAQVQRGAVSLPELPNAIYANAASTDKAGLEARLVAAMCVAEMMEARDKATSYAANPELGRRYLACLSGGKASGLTQARAALPSGGPD